MLVPDAWHVLALSQLFFFGQKYVPRAGRPPFSNALNRLVLELDLRVVLYS